MKHGKIELEGALENDQAIASDMIIENKDQDKDILIKANDGGASTTMIQVHGDNGIISIPNQSACYVHRNTSVQTVAHNSSTKIEFNGEKYDVQNEFDSSSNYRFTAKEAGKYLIHGTIYIPTTVADKKYSILLYINGGDKGGQHTHTSNTNGTSVLFSRIESLSANDYVELNLLHNAGVDQDINPGYNYSWLCIHKLS